MSPPSETELRRHLAGDPQRREAWRPLAFAHAARNQAAYAATIFDRLAALRPEAPDLSNRAVLHHAAGDRAAARSARRALALEPALAAAHNSRGDIAMQRDRLAEAETAFARALSIDPAFRDATYNLAVARNDQGDPERAIVLYKRALARSPDFFEARWNLALALLATGRWREGWRAHEIRRSHPRLKPRDFPIPGWTGEPLAGRRILVASEQGLGDILQFLRFVPEVARRGGRVTLDLPASLLPLARSLAGVERLIEEDAPPGEVDLTVPLMSLPLRLGLGETAAAPLAPYLAPPPHSAPSPAIARDGRPLVGLNWAGNPVNRADARRSLALDRLRPLLAERGIRFVSLQFGPNAADIAKAGLEDRLETPALGDFASTATIVASLDLVVTVDTAMAHLAGAIAKEAWVLLAYAPDWRWGMSGETTSWYPSLRLFRQASPGDWDGVVAKLARALGERFPASLGTTQPPHRLDEEGRLDEDGRLHEEGLAFWRAGDLDRALEAIGQAIDLSPETALFHTSFGVVLAALGEAASAAAAWRSALGLDPAEPLAWVNLANAIEADDESRALGFYRRALGLDPLNAAALGNLGALEQRRGDSSAALRRYAEALSLDPAEPRLWSNLGSARHWAGRLGAAGLAFDRALALAPDFAGARFDRAVNRLLQGDYASGLRDYEARWLKPGAPRPPIDRPPWRGEAPDGKSLVLWAEQGQGDTLQFLRFVPAVVRRGARVILLVSRRMVSLLSDFPGVERVVSSEDPLPAAELQAPLMSLPLLLGLGEAAAAPVAPYLAPPSSITIERDGRPLVGLVWAGNPANESDRRRSLSLERLGPLLAKQGLRFVSLQFGPNAADVANAGLADRLETPALGDFASSAAIVAALDLVITVDTAMAHLAGAMGKEAWVLLAHVPDWRWGMSGETTSWYPSLRLFRQASPGDWDGVVAKLSMALGERFPGAVGE